MTELDSIFELTTEDSKLLFSNKINEQHIEIHEYNQLRWMQIDGTSIQSVMHIEKPDYLISPINSAMCLALAFPEQCKTLLNIGFGGGAFERCFRSKLPELEIDSVESNEIIIHLAREYFLIPFNYPVYNTQANTYLQEVDENYDVILCDIFDNEYHPECLYQESFYENAAKNLKSDGVLSLNLTPDNEEDLVNLLLALRKSFLQISLLNFDDHKNIIIFACKQKIATSSSLEKRSARLEKKLNMDLLEILAKLHPLPEPVASDP